MPNEKEEEEKYEVEDHHPDRLHDHSSDDIHHHGADGHTQHPYAINDDDDEDDHNNRGGDSHYTDGDSRYTEDDSRYHDDGASRFTEDDSRYTEDQSHDDDHDHDRHHHGEEDSFDHTNDHHEDHEDDHSHQVDGRNHKNDKAERFRNEDEDDDDDADEDEFLKNDDCCKGCADGCSRRCPCCTPCCNVFQKCCACLYPHGWYALLGQILAVLAFIVTVLGYVSCYDAQEGDHNMSFVGQGLVSHHNNSYAGCLSWPHHHPPELDQMWKIGKSMDVVSMISGIVCVVWILTFACFRWAKPLRYVLIALFLFTGCAAGLALLAFKSKLCHTDPFHCNIVPAAVISGCAALNWCVCAFIVWHLQDPADPEDDEDFDEEDEHEDDGDDKDDRVNKRGHREKPEVIVEDLPDGSRKITKIKRRRDGSEKITETIIPAEEINYQQQQVKPYPEPDNSMLSPHDGEEEYEEEDQHDSESAPMVETFRDEPIAGDDGFVTGFKPEPYHIPVQPNQTAAGGSREMHVEPGTETNEQGQLLLLPMDDDEHKQHQQPSQPTPPVPDLLDDHYREATVEEQHQDHGHTEAFAAPPPQQHLDLLDQSAVAMPSPQQPDLLDDHGGYNTCDDESRDMMFHDDDDDDEDIAAMLSNANQRSASAPQPVLPQLTRPDDFRLKADDYDNGIPLDPPTDPSFLAPAPRLDPPNRYSIHDDEDGEKEGNVPEIV